MFLGTYEHALDAKGRIILPAKFRARLSDGCVLVRGLDRCLFLYPKEEWERVAERLSESRVTSQQRRNFERFLFSGASEEVPDRQGRITIPEPLRRYASLERDIAVIGAGNRVEVWDRAAWERFVSESEEQYAGLTEAHPDVPV